jgi:PAS domain S-box-containing protein
MRRFWLSALAALIGFAALGGVLIFLELRSSAERIEANRLAAHSRATLGEARQLLLALLDAETGQRGFLLTQHRAYLEPYIAGRDAVSAELQRLETLSGGDPSQQERLTAIRDVVAARLAVLATTIAMAEQGDRDGALAIVASGRGKALMDEARRQIAALAAEEDRVAAERELLGTAAMRRDRNITYAVLVLGAALLAVAAATTAGGFLAINRIQLTAARLSRQAALLDLAQESILTWEIGGGIIYWNRAAETLYGYAAAEALGRRTHDLLKTELPLPPDEFDALLKHEGAWKGTLRHSAKNGRRIVVEASLVLVDGVDGKSTVLETNRDITDRMRAEEALRQFNVELEQRVTATVAERETALTQLSQAQKMEAVGQLTGGVAHDFNNLLQVILGNLDAVRRRLQRGEAVPSADLAQRLGAAIRSGERGARLTQQLLAFARRQPLAPKQLDANKLVAGMSDMLHRTLGETVEIKTILAAGLWPILADPNQLESAMLNLALNARDAMPKGGKLTIETANAYLDDDYALQHKEVQAGHYVLIAVSDTGTGMDKDVLGKAFEPFFTTKEAGQGTGLGLSQVYGFVKQSGGHVKIYSERGGGTTVKLYLPQDLAATAVADHPAERTVPTGAPEEVILIVEDEAEVRANASDMLRELGYEVAEAPDGATALRILESSPHVRLLFTDIGLPGGSNGRQVADEAIRLRPGLKLLFTTGYARNAIVHQGRLDPGIELLPKPFTFTELAMKIRRALDG